MLQGSEKKKFRMMYADPDDHNFNYTRKYIGGGSMHGSFAGGGLGGIIVGGEWGETPSRRGASSFARERISSAMPAIRAGPLSNVKPISNEDEDELI